MCRKAHARFASSLMAWTALMSCSRFEQFELSVLPQNFYATATPQLLPPAPIAFAIDSLHPADEGQPLHGFSAALRAAEEEQEAPAFGIFVAEVASGKVHVYNAGAIAAEHHLGSDVGNNYKVLCTDNEYALPKNTPLKAVVYFPYADRNRIDPADLAAFNTLIPSTDINSDYIFMTPLEAKYFYAERTFTLTDGETNLQYLSFEQQPVGALRFCVYTLDPDHISFNTPNSGCQLAVKQFYAVRYDQIGALGTYETPGTPSPPKTYNIGPTVALHMQKEADNPPTFFSKEWIPCSLQGATLTLTDDNALTYSCTFPDGYYLKRQIITLINGTIIIF
jgi:hypothetical protein